MGGGGISLLFFQRLFPCNRIPARKEYVYVACLRVACTFTQNRLLGLIERVASLKLRIEATVGEGWRLIGVVPCTGGAILFSQRIRRHY